MALVDMVNEYQELLVKKESLEKAVDENNEMIKAKKQEIVQQMIDDDCPRISVGELQVKNQFSKKAEAYLEAQGLNFFDVLREQGLGDLIKETVNQRSLQSAMKELKKAKGGN